jgi:hypothetical protein
MGHGKAGPTNSPQNDGNARDVHFGASADFKWLTWVSLPGDTDIADQHGGSESVTKMQATLQGCDHFRNGFSDGFETRLTTKLGSPENRRFSWQTEAQRPNGYSPVAGVTLGWTSAKCHPAESWT